MTNVWSPTLLERIKKFDRCLRILENVRNKLSKLYRLVINVF